MANIWENNGSSEIIYFLKHQNHCSHEIERHLLLVRKAMKNLDSLLESRDITLPTTVRIVKAIVFPVITYRYESWNIRKTEYLRIDAFELWCWRRLLRVPWSAKKSKQSILKEINTEYSFSSVQFSCSFVYDSLRLHELQHTRPPCP